jgi:hypothetical protein
MNNFSNSESHTISHLSSILASYTTQDESSGLLSDGDYVTNVWCHPKGVRERTVSIINGVVHVPDSGSKSGFMKFSQSSFFGPNSNVLVRQL